MAMDALKNLETHVPTWLKRLDELSGQIDQRQAELAAVALAEGKSAETKSLRNKGSTESLKPADDPSPYPDAAPEPVISEAIPEESYPAVAKPSTPIVDAQQQQQPLASPPSPSAAKPSPDAIKAARAHVRAQVKRKQRSASMLSGEDAATPAYRTRTMIIVYYDSYVQSFFDDLVRFVSSSRNLMRKAKMAAKVAQIKKMAEMEVPDDDSADGELAALPSLKFMSTRRFGPMSMGRAGGARDPPDIYDNLDKGLEFVQSMCEHGAHQFLRDGDCNDEIAKAQKRLAEVLQMAIKEMERVRKEEPELAKETGDLGKVRTRRPISMRRDMLAQKDGSSTPTKEEPPKLEADAPLEADTPAPAKTAQTSGGLGSTDIIEADEGIDVDMEPPKLEFRSTRAMRRPQMP